MSYFVAKNLSVSKKDTEIIKNINFSIQKGELVSILGPSGCGKTTLLNAMLGFEEHKGKLFLDQQDLVYMTPGERNFSAVFQGLNLFPHLSVAENILYGLSKKSLSFKKEKLDELISLIHLEGRENASISVLSGGEKQRVAIARSLAVEPDLIFLDEPFSSLDQSLKVDLRHFIKKVLKKKNIGSFLVTHDKEDAFHFSDTVMIMNKGEILQSGSPKEVYQNPKSLFVRDFFSEFITIDGRDIFTHDLIIGTKSDSLFSAFVDDCYFINSFYKVILKTYDGKAINILCDKPVEYGENLHLKLK